MIPSLIRNAADLPSTLQRLVIRHRPELVTFDVFDTVLLRLCHPDVVTAATVAKMAELAGIDKKLCARLRQRAHRKCCAGATVRGLDPEAGIVEWYGDWARLCTDGAIDSAGLAAEIIEFELETERRSLLVDERAVAAIQAARAQGAKVVAVSDMYLSGDHIRSLLGRDDLFDVIFTSGDVGYLKRTGRLFDHVGTTLGVSPNRHLHVGDDLLADCIRPASRGIRCTLLRDVEQSSRRTRATERRLRENREPLALGMAAMDYAFAAPYVASHHQLVGFESFGPVMAPFVHALADRCAKAGVDKVYFLAREGLVLKRLYDDFVEVTGMKAPPSAYVCVSRYTTLLAQMRSFGEVEREVVRDNTAVRTPRNLLSVLSVPPADLEMLCARHGLDADSPVDVEDTAFVALCEDGDLAAMASEAGEAMRSGLTRHLGDAGFLDAGRVAIVDVGWGGQIQENLTRFLSGRDRAPEILGFYFGLNDRAVRRIEAGLAMEGLVAEKWSADWTTEAVFEFVMALEAGTRAPHGSTVGYEADGTPVFAQPTSIARRAEEADDPVLCAIQVGMVDFMERYARFAAMTGMPSSAAIPVARGALARLIRFPTKRERDAFFGMVNVANLGSEEILPYIDSRITWRKPWFSLKKARWSLWQEGAIGRLLGRPGQLAFIGAKTFMTTPSPTIAPGHLPEPGPRNGIVGIQVDHLADELWAKVVSQAESGQDAHLAATRLRLSTHLLKAGWLVFAVSRAVRRKPIDKSGIPTRSGAWSRRSAIAQAASEGTVTGAAVRLGLKLLGRVA